MIWSVESGFSFGVFQERRPLSFTLPVNYPTATIQHISGTIPAGMRLEGHQLVGTPYEVPRDTSYDFVLRAFYNDDFEDKTLNVTIVGADDPEWITNQGALPAGTNNSYFVLDSSPVDFHLQAIDTDIVAGDELEFFIASGDGELPPGLQLTSDGRIIGIVDPILSLDVREKGEYETTLYDSSYYDYAVKSFNGFSSYFYDTEIYDLSIETQVPKKLNRYYQFRVSVSDGENDPVKREFRIYVVGDDFLRTDNTIMQVATGLFTADNTNIRTPIWVTPANLGFRRANNYVTILLEVIDNNTLEGELSYILLPNNPDNTPSILPPGLDLENADGEIAGRVPYQPAVTKEYKFTVRAQRVTPDEDSVFKDKTFIIKMLGEIESVITWETQSLVGTIPANNISNLSVLAKTSLPNSKVFYRVLSGKLPPGLSLDIQGQIIGKVNQFKTDELIGLTTFDNNTTIFDGGTTTVDRNYTFIVEARDQLGYSATTKEFTIQVDDPDDRLYSNVYLKPLLKETQRQNLLNFINDGDVFNVKNLYRPNDPNFGLQKELKILLYPGIETKDIEEYVAATSTHHKRKKYRLGGLKTAQAKLPGSNEVLYEVVYVELIDPNQKDETSRKTISIDSKDKFTADSVEYAVKDDVTKFETGQPYVTVTKRYGSDVSIFTDANGFPVYEQDGDVLQTTLGNLQPLYDDSAVDRLRPNGDTIKVDTNSVKVSDPNKNVQYISNINNMRENIRQTGVTDRDFLPLWMKTSQPGQIEQLGFVPSLVLCYCKPGLSEEIFFNIQNNGFDFKTLDLDVDRYVIDSTSGNSQEQYIVFRRNLLNV